MRLFHQYQGYTKFIDRKSLPPCRIKNLSLEELGENTGFNTLNRIRERGAIRFDLLRALPYAFNNKQGDLVGFDIELIHLLARELKVSIEFVKLNQEEAATLLQKGDIDLASGVPLITENLSKFTLSLPYSEETIALVVKDDQRNKFKSLNQLKKLPELALGVPNHFFYKEVLFKNFSNAKLKMLLTKTIF